MMHQSEDLIKSVFGSRAAFYTNSACHKDPQILAQMVDWAAPEPYWKVLDIATGTGHTAFALAPFVAEVVGVDLTPEMLQEAEKLKKDYQAFNVSFRQADAHHLPFADAAFELVTCRRAAHHFADIRQALREMRRVLKPAGKLVIDDRSVPEDEQIDRWLNQLDWFHDHSHVRQYRASQWQTLLQEAGFLVGKLETYTRSRPVSAFMDGTAPEDIDQIQALLAQIDAPHRQRMNMVENEGELYLDHWYLMILAQSRHT